MYYINATANKAGDYGNPMGQPFDGCLKLPRGLLSAYIEAKGFVILDEVVDGEVVCLEVNQEALDSYIAEHTEAPDKEPEPTEEDDTAAILIDHEYRLILLELGLTE